MKSGFFLIILSILIGYNSSAQIKNARTEVFKVSGNCEMCKATIEKAGSFKKISKVKYSLENQEAVITYDSLQTNADIILQKIAESGYDNERYKASDDVYEKLPACCHYTRKEEQNRE